MNDIAVAGECLQSYRDRTGDEYDIVGARLRARFYMQIDKFLNS